MRGGEPAGRSTVDVRILGSVEVWRVSSRLSLPAGKQRVLLASLALRPNQVVSVDTLIDDVWGAQAPAQAEKTLRAHVSHLRALLAGRDSDDDGPVLVARRPGYALEIRDELLDATRFLALVKDGRAALSASEPRRAATLLSGALALWRGEIAAGSTLSANLAARAVVFEEERIGALEDRVDADLALGRHAQVIGEVDALVATYPLRERLRSLQMLALYRSGRQAEALRAYQRARETLVEELGIEPGAELRTLEAAILRQDPELAAPAPADVATEGARRSRAGPAIDVPAAGGGLVGRAPEVSMLWDGLADAQRGRGHVFGFVGEGGAGKTRLLDELAARADVSGPVVLRGRCDEASGAPPFWPWVQVLRDFLSLRGDDDMRAAAGTHGGDVVALVPELATRIDSFEAPPLLEPDAARFRLFDAVSGLLLRAGRIAPLVLLLDDLQWADVSSLQLLDFFARRIAAAPVLVAAAWRGDDVDPTAPLGRAMAGLASAPCATIITLDGLSGNDVALLLEAVMAAPVADDVAAGVRERTGGNPLFVLELGRLARAGVTTLAAAADPLSAVPHTLRSIVTRRIENVAPPGRVVLELAATAGRRFTLAELQRASVVDRGDLLQGVDEAAGTGAIRPVAGSATAYEFLHDLLRQAVYESIPLRRRAELHAALGRGIESIDPAGSRLEEVAEHFSRAAATGGPDADKAIDYAVAVGDRAERAHAYDRAASTYERALELAAFGTRSDDPGELLVRLGRARWHAGDVAGSRDAYECALAAARLNRSGATLARAALGLGVRGVTNGVVDAHLVSSLNEALDALRHDDPDLRSRVLARLSMELYFSADGDRSVGLAHDAVELARTALDRAAVSEALLALHFCLRRPGQLGDRRPVAAEALAAAERAGVPELVLRARHARIGDLVEAGDLAGLVEEIEAYAGLAEEVRQPVYRAHVLAWRALVAQVQGNVERAEQLAEVALELGSPLEPEVFLQIYGAQLGTLRWEQGRSAEIADEVRRFVEAYPGAPAWRSALALFFCEQGRLDLAQREFDTLAAEEFAGIPRDANWLAAMAVSAMVCGALGDAARARQLYGLLSPHEQVFVAVGGVAASACYGSVSFFLGVLARTCGDCEAAAGHFRTAVTANRRMGAAPWVARAETALGELDRASA